MKNDDTTICLDELVVIYSCDAVPSTTYQALVAWLKSPMSCCRSAGAVMIVVVSTV